MTDTALVSYDQALPGPLPSAPARRPGSIRRTTNVDGTRGGGRGFGGVVAIEAAGRDLLTPMRADAVVLDTASLAVELDEDGRIAGVDARPSDVDLAALVG